SRTAPLVKPNEAAHLRRDIVGCTRPAAAADVNIHAQRRTMRISPILGRTRAPDLGVSVGYPRRQPVSMSGRVMVPWPTVSTSTRYDDPRPTISWYVDSSTPTQLALLLPAFAVAMHDDVYATLRSGAHAVTADGQVITLAAQPAASPDRSGLADLHLRAAAAVSDAAGIFDATASAPLAPHPTTSVMAPASTMPRPVRRVGALSSFMPRYSDAIARLASELGPRKYYAAL
ncbi:MAG: hypothetical protein ABR525_10940, partial [Candidatus Limnocylindria bacterium]